MLTFFDLANLKRDLWAFLPEVVVCGAIVVLLLSRLLPGSSPRRHLGPLALLLAFGALALSYVQWRATPAGDPSQACFGGLMVIDTLSLYLRLFVYGATVLTIILNLLTGIPDAEDSADFNVLLLGGALGMSLMGSANHLLMVYVAVEMASLPSYALAGFLKGRRQASEAALKYVVYGGGASAIMLYGISFVAGKFGTGLLPDVAVAYAATAKAGIADPVLVLGTLFILIGLAFKLSAVPFHFWCPDVFEGAAAEVAGFLSVASKGGAFVLTARLLATLVGAGAGEPGSLVTTFGPAVAAFAALTATFGNLAAYSQTNLKRLLAYSTIAHAGYMLMGLATLTPAGTSAVLFYLATYLFTNLAAFAVIAFLRNRTGSEELGDFKGLVYRQPAMVVILGICFVSLLGLPPLAGFAAKFQVFSAVFDAFRLHRDAHPNLAGVYLWLLAIGGANTVFSAVYYLRVLRVMVLEKPDTADADEPIRVPVPAAVYGWVLAGFVVALGVTWDFLVKASDKGARPLAGVSRPAVVVAEVPAAAKAEK